MGASTSEPIAAPEPIEQTPRAVQAEEMAALPPTENEET
jgi:hypothetical protein